MMKQIVFLAAVFFLSACASSVAKQHELDLALSSPTELKNLCAAQHAAACALLGEKTVLKKPLPILQSETSAVQTRFVIVVPSEAELHYYVRAPDGKITQLKSERLHAPTSMSNALDQVEAFELKPRISYELIVLGPEGGVWDRRDFSALDAAKHRARLVVASEMGSGHSSEQDKMWQQMARLKPDLLLLLGGNWGGLSAKGESAEEIWKQAFQARLAQGLYQFNPLIPVFATWNDQEFGKKSGDRTNPGKEAARDAFTSFFAQKSPAEGFLPGPGVASKLSAFGASFLLLDNRSFRSPDGVDLPDQTHFGETQEAWLKDALHDGHEPVFLCSGDLFFGAGYETQQPKSFAASLVEWKKQKHPLIFMSGNHHFTEFVKIPAEKLGYTSYELTSSPLRKIKNEIDTHANGDQVASFAGEMSFVLLELVRQERGFLQFAAEIYGPGQKQEFQRTLTVKSL